MHTRRTGFIALLCGITLLAGCAGTGGGGDDSAATDATGEFDWKRYEGDSISVMLTEHPWTAALEERLGEFEELTGITVDLQTYSEDLYTDKVEQALRTESAPGAYMIPMDDAGAAQFDAGLIEPLTPFLDNASLTNADYDVADFPEGLVSPGMLPAGDPNAQLYEIPISTESYILFYNKAIVDEYLDGEVPQTMSDLVAASEDITARGGGEVYGSVVRGVRSEGLRDTLTAFVLNESPLDVPIEAPYNVWFDGAWDAPRLDGAPVVDGLGAYAGLIAAGPPNKFNIDWPDATSLFQQGKAAFFVDASVFGPQFEDAEQSAVAGNVGYAPLPAGAAADGGTGVWSWGLSMGANSENKGANWLFMQWATGPELTAELGAATGGAPRQSSASNPAYTDALVPEFVEVTTDAASTARTTAVLRGDWKPGLLLIVDATLAIAGGADAQDTLDAANEQMKSTIE